MKVSSFIIFILLFGLFSCSNKSETVILNSKIDSLEQNIYLKDKVLKAYEDMLLEEHVVVGYTIQSDSAVVLEIVEDNEGFEDLSLELKDSLSSRN